MESFKDLLGTFCCCWERGLGVFPFRTSSAGAEFSIILKSESTDKLMLLKPDDASRVKMSKMTVPEFKIVGWVGLGSECDVRCGCRWWRDDTVEFIEALLECAFHYDLTSLLLNQYPPIVL